MAGEGVRGEGVNRVRELGARVGGGIGVEVKRSGLRGGGESGSAVKFCYCYCIFDTEQF